jgi:biotin carboxylase
MQVVESEDEFESAMKLCQGRALSAFGDDRVFLEKFIEGAQHIEFQVLGDGKDAIHFGERFCSIQRRHQKILEEGPWLSDEIRKEIGDKVVAGAKAVGYCGLATFEFLRDSRGDFYFLEVNPRVQVEHTVTEMITGNDLVSMGIRVASGEPIKLIQDDIQIRGHAIQVRLNAENPITLSPSPGKLWECHWPGGPGVRIDTHAHTGYDMPASFDSLLAKLIVWAPTRDESISKLTAALNEIKLLGVDTLIPLHLAILSENDFRKRDITIHYLEEHPNLLSGG